MYANVTVHCENVDSDTIIKSATTWSEDNIEVSNLRKKARMTKHNKNSKRTKAVHVPDTDDESNSLASGE